MNRFRDKKTGAIYNVSSPDVLAYFEKEARYEKVEEVKKNKRGSKPEVVEPQGQEDPAEPKAEE